MFTHANYFLNFSKLLGVTKDSKVSCETSQNQILKMYESGQEIPWDLRKPQPAIESAYAEGLFRGVVLDAGCGFGDNAIYLAAKGIKVVGFDFSAKAIEVAKDRAVKSGVAHLCEFVQADALNMDQSCLRGRLFDTILDSACLQCFDPSKQGRYIANIEPLLKPGGNLVILVVCNQSQLRSWCRGLKWMESHLTNLFTRERSWVIRRLEHCTFLENIPMVRISKGVRTFEPVTPSPCIRMVAVRPAGGLARGALAAGAVVVVAAAVAAALLRVWARRP